MPTRNRPTSLYDKVCKMYEQIGLGKNDICKKCKPLNNTPVSIRIVGNKFAEDEYKVLFVGKTVWSNWSKGEDSDINKSKKYKYIDASKDSWPPKEKFLEKGKPFWRYTREIASKLYGGSPEKAVERIAVTNIIKCADSNKSQDTTRRSVKENCIIELGVIRNEIKILKPKHIVFYTCTKYDDFIERLKFGGKQEMGEKLKFPRLYRKGQCPLHLWQINHYDRNGHISMKWLRTSHPQGQKIERFVDIVVSWIKGKRNYI